MAQRHCPSRQPEKTKSEIDTNVSCAVVRFDFGYMSDMDASTDMLGAFMIDNGTKAF